MRVCDGVFIRKVVRLLRVAEGGRGMNTILAMLSLITASSTTRHGVSTSRSERPAAAAEALQEIGRHVAIIVRVELRQVRDSGLLVVG